MHFSPRPNRAAEIRWRPWGAQAFKESEESNKPILLGISAVWCHWCHVMDETSYSDDEVIRLINKRFVPVRVDNDQRPDVNARYNMGGWPTTVFLTPRGDILHGGTYYPPEIMRSLLAQIADFYAQPGNRLAIGARSAELRARHASKTDEAAETPLDPATPKNVLLAMKRSFDEEYGGFGDEPKFPQVSALNFLLEYYARTKDDDARTMAQKTLRAMAGGGMYDHVEGGFFRYSTTRDWSIPHFEKMLEDLSGLLLVCSRAAAMFDDADLRNVAIDVKRYIDATLWNAGAQAYGGSQDADEEYYLADAAGRAKLHRPYVDPIIYTAWNAQMAQAQLLSSRWLGDDALAWAETGARVLETLWSKSLVDGVMARYYDGAPHIRGLLVDQAWSAQAALATFSLTNRSVWLDRVRDLIDAADALFDARAGLYRDRPHDPDEPGRVAEPSLPLEENALMARALLAYAAFAGNAARADRAAGILSRFPSGYGSLGAFAAGYASAVLDVAEPPIDVHVLGTADAAATTALRDAALELPAPPLRVDVIDPQRDAARLTTLGYDAQAEPIAYLCRGTACFARVKAPAELVAALRDPPVAIELRSTSTLF